MTSTLELIEREAGNLSPEEQLKLITHLMSRLRTRKERARQSTAGVWISPVKLYGAAKGLYNEDAQEYINRTREDRL